MSYSRYLRTRVDVDTMCEDEQDDFESFCDWLDDVEYIVRGQTGVKMVDMYDQEYREMYDDGWDVEEVARRVLAAFRTGLFA